MGQKRTRAHGYRGEPRCLLATLKPATMGAQLIDKQQADRRHARRTVQSLCFVIVLVCYEYHRVVRDTVLVQVYEAST